jgi:hypothetical protein
MAALGDPQPRLGLGSYSFSDTSCYKVEATAPLRKLAVFLYVGSMHRRARAYTAAKFLEYI